MMEEQRAGGAKVTDLNYLEKLSKGNAAFMNDMIGIFLTENPAEISTLENAIAAEDYGAIAAAAHKLRSTVPFVGIDKIINTDIARVESLAQKNGSPYGEKVAGQAENVLPEIREHFSRIKSVCEKAVSELKERKA